MRIICVTGKGGSGVSSHAAAAAVAGASGGGRTLAFGLGPGLQSALGDRPEVNDGRLRVEEGGPDDDGPDALRDWLSQLLDWRGMDPLLADDLSALPGLGYVGRLLVLEARIRDEAWDLVVLDCPPLAQFVDLVSGLDAAARWLDRLFPPRQPTVFEPFLRALTAYAPSGEDVYEEGRALLLRLARLREMLSDPDSSSVRIVLPAEASAAAEAPRTIAELSLFGYPVEALVVNRLLPQEAVGTFLEEAREAQQEVVKSLGESLRPLPVLTADLQSPAGKTLQALASLYESRGPAGPHRRPAPLLSQQDGHYVLRLAVPYARREELRLEQGEDGLLVRLGRRRRFVALPPEVRHLEAASTFDGETLTVSFADHGAGQKGR